MIRDGARRVVIVELLHAGCKLAHILAWTRELKG